MGEEIEFKIELIYEETGTVEPRKGGQHVGTPNTAVRVTHLPTGLMAQSTYGRSQHRNRQLAMTMVEWGLLNWSGR